MDRPFGLLAELTYACPLHCPYCSNPLNLGDYREELTTQQWRQVIAEAGELGVLQLHLSGGEPLQRRDLADIVRFAVDAYVTFARTRPWVEAVASSLTELFAPDLMAERLAAFERCYTWIDRDELTYFRARLSQAPRDSRHALRVVTQRCRTRHEQAAALAALSFKCDVLWSMLDAIDRAYADR